MTKTKNKRKFLKTTVATSLIASTLVAPVSASAFSDIDPSNSHYSSIMNLLNRNIISGFEDGTFRPNQEITRGQAAKIIAKTLNLNVHNLNDPGFSDVQPSNQYYSYIAALANANIINGYSDKTFKPSDPITRGQMAKILSLGFNLESKNSQTPFNDVPSSHQYSKYVSALYELGVTHGKSATTFDLTSYVTRGQLASFVVRAENTTASQEKTISGIIEDISGGKVIIEGNAYNIEDFTFLSASQNKQALIGATIEFVSKQSKIENINKLQLNSAAVIFDAHGQTINFLQIPNTIKNVSNIKAIKIEHSLGSEAIKATNVVTKEYYISSKQPLTASISNLPMVLANTASFTDSSIENLYIDSTTFNLAESNSNINNLHAENANTFILDGLYDNVYLNSNIHLSGKATINTLIFSEIPTGQTIDPTIQISSAVINGQTLDWSEAISLYNIQYVVPKPPVENNNLDGSNSNNTGGNNNGDGGNNFGESNNGDGGNNSGESNNGTDDNHSGESNNGTDDNHSGESNNGTDDNHSGESNNDTDDNHSGESNNGTDDNHSGESNNGTDDNHSGESNNGTDDNHSGESNNGTDDNHSGESNNGTGGNNSGESNNDTDDNHSGESNNGTDDNNNTIATRPTVTTDENNNVFVTVSNGNNEEAQYTVSNTSLKQLFTTYGNEIVTANLIVAGQEITDISALTIATAKFDGTILNETAVNQLTLTNSTEITNVSNIDQLIVQTNGDVNFSNVNVAVTLQGNISAVTGDVTNLVTIATTSSHVNVDVTNADIVINQAPTVAKSLSNSKIASLNSTFIANQTTTLTVVFKSADPSKTVTINREDTILDIQKGVFSKLTINQDNVDIFANQSLTQVMVSSGVTVLTLHQDVEELRVNLENPLALVGGIGNITIAKLTVETTKPDTNGWIDLVNVVITDGTLNDGELTEDIYKKAPTTSTTLTPFTSSLDYANFLEYKINTTLGPDESLEIATVGQGVDITPYLTTKPNGTTSYTTGTPVPLYADIEKVLVYKIKAGVAIGVSTVELPVGYPTVALTSLNTAKEQLIFSTRFRDTDTVSNKLSYLYVIQNGKIISQNNNLSGSWTKTDNVNTYTTTLTADINGKREIYLLKDTIITTQDNTVAKYETDYISALKTMASEAARLNDNTMVVPILNSLFMNTNANYDSFFLSKYIEEINKAPGNYTTLKNLEDLSTSIQTNNNYEKDAVLSANDLHFTGSITNNYSYSESNVVTNSLSDTGELLFIAKAQGSTTLRVTDSNGNASLVNVVVDANNKVTATVLKANITAGTLLDGKTAFRISPTDSSVLLPTVLQDSFAFIESTTGLAYQGVSLTNIGNTYSLSAVHDITLTELTFTELGLTNATNFEGTSVGIFKTTTGIALYPKLATNETILIGDGTNIVAVNTTSSVNQVTRAQVVKSYDGVIDKKFSLSNLGLNNIETVSKSPNNAGVYLVTTNGETQLFANSETVGSLILKDSQNKTAIINAKVASTINGLEVTEFSILQKQITTDASITEIEGTSVRNSGLTLYAIGEGTSIITLSDGKQYKTTITKGANNQYVMTELEKVDNFTISAAELHMTNINQAISSNGSSDTITFDNTRLVLNRPTDGTSTLTVISNTEPTERVILYVTKTGNTYTYTIALHNTLTANQLGLTEIKEVVGSISPYARPVVTTNKELLIYAYGAGNRTFQVSDGANKTVINVTVKNENSQLTTTATPVTHTLSLPEGYTPVDANFKTNAAFLKNGILYATGDIKEATIEIPVKKDNAEQLTYVIKLKADTNSGLFSFDETPTITFNKSFTLAQLGLETLIEAIVPSGLNASATISGANVNLSVTGNVTDGRIEIIGTNKSETNVKAMIYVSRAGNIVSTEVEKSAAIIDLTAYGYNDETPTGAWSIGSIARANIATNLKNIDFYSLEKGDSVYTLTNSQNKKLLINVTVAGSNDSLRTVTAQVVESEIEENSAIEILAGNAVRLSSDKKHVYAIAEGTAKVLLADGKIVQYTVVKDPGTSQFTITPTPLSSSLKILTDDLGLTDPLTAIIDNTAVASVTLASDGLIIYGATAGKTSMTVTDATGKKVRVNLTVDSDLKVTTDSPAMIVSTKFSTIAPETLTKMTIINNDDLNKIHIDNSTIYALESGTVELLVETSTGFAIYETVISKTNNHYSISTPALISNAIFSPSDLGFTATPAMQIANSNENNFTVKEVEGKIIAYSNLTGATTGNTEFIVTAIDDDISTLVRLKDTGAGAIESKIAVRAETFGGTDPSSIADTTIARYKDGKIYSLKPGYTFATVNGYLQAIDVSRDTDGYLSAAVRPLKEIGTGFAKISETDETIVTISADGTTLSAKALGTTKVKNSTGVQLVTIKQDTNGKVTMALTPITSKFVGVADFGLTQILSTEVIYGNTNAITINRDENNGLTLYSNGATSAQTLAIRVTGADSDKAIVNVTIDETGQITDAKVLKSEPITNLPTQTAQTVKSTTARAVSNGTNIIVYATEVGNTSLKFTNGLLNVQVTKDGNKLAITKANLISHDFGAEINTITNSSLLNIDGSKVYPKAIGESLVYVGDKIYSISVTEVNEQFILKVSDGVSFTKLDLNAIGGTYAQDKSILNGTKAVIDEDSTKDLIIYADGSGVSDLAIKIGTDYVIYHVTASTTTVSTPIESVATLPTGMTAATVKTGTNIRITDEKMYYQSLGNTTLINNNRLINAAVTRDENGHFKATPTYVSATLKEDFTVSSTKFEKDIANAKVIYALNDAAKETFYTANYRVSAETKLVDGLYALTVDERHMKQFKGSDFGLTGTIRLKDGGNTVATVATPEVDGDTITIYAGTVAATTAITMTDGTNEVVFNVTRDNDGNITVTPQASLESLKFTDIDLTDLTNKPITISSNVGLAYDSNVIGVVATATGLNITAKKAGSTALALVQDSKVVRLINVTVESVNGNLQVTTPTAVKFETTGTLLAGNVTTEVHNGSHYITAIGNGLYDTANNTATYVSITRNGEKGTFNTSISQNHTLSKLTTGAVGLSAITHVSLAGSSVSTMRNNDNSEIYIFGTNPGFTDVVLSNGTQYTTVVANNGASLSTTVAKKALDPIDQVATTWEANLVEIRDHVIYAANVGKEVATAKIGETDVLMNVSVTRNTNQTFAISYDLVDATFTEGDVTILSGSSVKLAEDTKRIFAQETGTSKIKVGTSIYDVYVTKGADGHYKLEVSQPVVQHTITAAQLGLTTLSSDTIHAITGTGVVSTKIHNNELIIYAQNAGQAEVTITGKLKVTDELSLTVDTVVHLLVTESLNKLSIEPKIAKETFNGANTLENGHGIIRAVDNELFALAEGKAVSKINNELHNISVTKVGSKLVPAAQRIEATLPGTVTVPTASKIFKADGNKVVAIGNFGTEDITILEANNTTRTFRVTVTEDGFITYNELVGETIDVTNILGDITGVVTAKTDAVINAENKKLVKLTPKEAGTEIITITDGKSSIQAKVTVTGNPGSLVVETEILSAIFTTGDVGFYPTEITLPSGAVFASKQGVIKLENGIITLYPGEKGTTHLLIKGNDRQAMYELKVNDDLSYSFAPFVQTVNYDAFKSSTTVLDTSGSAKAVADTTGLNVTFKDEEETIFVVTGESGYKTLIAQAKTVGEMFNVSTPLVQNALAVQGEVSKVNGNLRTVVDGSSTVIYADQQSLAKASYTNGSRLYNVSVSTDAATKYKLTATQVIEETTIYSSATHLEKDDVVVLENNKWQAVKTGTGIYLTNTGDYVEVNVTLTDGHYSINVSPALPKVDLATLNVTTIKGILSTGGKLYTNKTFIYGTLPSATDAENKLIIDVELSNGKALVTGTSFSDLAVDLTSVKDLLDWDSSAIQNSLSNNTSSIVRIDGDNIYPIGVGTEVITFTTANGLSRTITVSVEQNKEGLYKISYTPSDKNIVEYIMSSVDGQGGFQVTHTLTFDTNVEIVEYDLITNSVATTALPITDGMINITMSSINNYVTSKTFKISFPELNTDEIFTISTKDRYTVTITMQNGSTIQFNKVESFE